MSRKGTFTSVLAVALACAGTTRAADPWEASDDNTTDTRNMMRPGERQIHDLEGMPPAFSPRSS